MNPIEAWLKQMREKREAATPIPWMADLGNWQIECNKTAHEEYRDGIVSFAPSERDGIRDRENPIDPIDDADFIVSSCNNSERLERALQVALKALNCIVSTVNTKQYIEKDCDILNAHERLRDLVEARFALQKIQNIAEEGLEK